MATMTAVLIPSAALWAGGGGALGRLMSGERTRRAVSLTMGLLLVATVVTVWV